MQSFMMHDSKRPHSRDLRDDPNLKYECAKDLCIIFAGLTLPSKPVANEIDVLLEGVRRESQYTPRQVILSGLQTGNQNNICRNLVSVFAALRRPSLRAFPSFLPTRDFTHTHKSTFNVDISEKLISDERRIYIDVEVHPTVL
jgi:hypothetical protein